MPRWRGILDENILASSNESFRVLLICNKPIPDPGFGQNMFRAFRIGFEFFAQLSHVNAQVLSMVGVSGSPDVRENALMRKYAPMIGGEIGK
jgi:hypothetical protein